MTLERPTFSGFTSPASAWAKPQGTKRFVVPQSGISSDKNNTYTNTSQTKDEPTPKAASSKFSTVKPLSKSQFRDLLQRSSTRRPSTGLEGFETLKYLPSYQRPVDRSYGDLRDGVAGAVNGGLDILRFFGTAPENAVRTIWHLPGNALANLEIAANGITNATPFWRGTEFKTFSSKEAMEQRANELNDSRPVGTLIDGWQKNIVKTFDAVPENRVYTAGKAVTYMATLAATAILLRKSYKHVVEHVTKATTVPDQLVHRYLHDAKKNIFTHIINIEQIAQKRLGGYLKTFGLDKGFFGGFVQQSADDAAKQFTEAMADYTLMTGQGVMNRVGNPLMRFGAVALPTGLGLSYFMEDLAGRRKKGKSPVTEDNVMAEIAKLQANPDAYMRDHYEKNVWLDRVLSGTKWRAEDFNPLSGQLQRYKDDHRDTVYFRRIPKDIFDAYRAYLAKSGKNLNGNKIFIDEIIRYGDGRIERDERGKPLSRPVELKTSFWSNPGQEGPWLKIQNAEGSKWYSNSTRIQFAFGAIEGFRPNATIEGTWNYRYDVDVAGRTVSTLRLGLPSGSQGLEVGMRQQKTNIWSRLAVNINPVDFNTRLVENMTNPDAAFSQSRTTFGAIRLYLDAGNRKRIRLDTTSIGKDPYSYMRFRQTGFMELGLGADFWRYQKGNMVTSLNGYYEGQLYVPDMRGELKLMGRPGRPWYEGTGLSALIPQFSVDPALQLTTNTFADLTPNVPGLNYNKPWTGSLPPPKPIPLNTVAGLPVMNRSYVERVEGILPTGSKGGGIVFKGLTPDGTPIYWLEGRTANYVVKDSEGNRIIDEAAALERARQMIAFGAADKGLRFGSPAVSKQKTKPAPAFASLSLTGNRLWTGSKTKLNSVLRPFNADRQTAPASGA